MRSSFLAGVCSLRAAFARVLTAFGLLLALAACGGGGGGGPSLSVSLSPSSITASFSQGSVYSFTDQATVNGQVPGQVFVAIQDLGGVIQPNVPIQQISGNVYSAAFSTLANLSVGEHKSSLNLKLCGDANCSQVYGGATLAYDFTVLPSPSASSITPSAAAAGGPGFELTVNGANFSNATQVFWNGQARSTTFVSSTQLSAQITAADLAAAGTDSVSVGNGAASQSSAGITFTVQNPTVASLSPGATTAGGPAFTLTVTGTGFNASSIVLWNGSPRSSSVVSASQITAMIMQSDIASGGADVVSVSNGSAGAVSNTAQFTVNNPPPVLASVSPSTLTAGGAGFVLTATGTAFTPASVVQWNGSGRPTIFVSATKLTAQIAAADIADGATPTVTVTSPSPGGGTSAGKVVTVNNPLPVLTTINASAAAAGCGEFTLYVVGSSFVPNSTVTWGGGARTTSFVSPTLLTAQVTAADIANAGTVAVKVSNPAPAGGTSSAASFTITSVVPQTTDAVSYLVNPAHTGEATTSCPVKLPASAAWTVNFGAESSYPLIAQGHVFIATSGQLFALDGATGSTVWGPVAANGAGPAYDNGLVFEVGNAPCCSAGAMLAYDAINGNLKWTGTMPGQYLFDSAATARNGLVYTSAAGDGGTVYALRESDGSLAWTASVANGDDSTPAVTASGLYVAYPCQAYDFNPATGASIWSRASGCDGGGGAVTVAGSTGVITPDGFGSYDGEFLNSQTGALLSTYSTPTPPALSGEYGYFVNNGAIEKINLSTQVIAWTFPGDGNLQAAPVLVNQVMFVVSTSGKLYAVDMTTGQQLWSSAVPNSTDAGIGWGRGYGPAMTAGDNLLVVPNGNAVTAFAIAAPH